MIIQKSRVLSIKTTNEKNLVNFFFINNETKKSHR